MSETFHSDFFSLRNGLTPPPPREVFREINHADRKFTFPVDKNSYANESGIENPSTREIHPMAAVASFILRGCPSTIRPLVPCLFINLITYS